MHARERVRRRALALMGWRVAHVPHGALDGALLRALLPLRCFPFLECTAGELAMDEGAIAARFCAELGWDRGAARAAAARALRAVGAVDRLLLGTVLPEVLALAGEAGEAEVGF